MRKDKICINKAFLYFVFLFLIIIGIFYLGYSANSKKLNSTTAKAFTINTPTRFLRRVTLYPTFTPTPTLPPYNCSKYGFYELNSSLFEAEVFNELKNNYCKDINKNDLYSYNGGWGSKAICYAKTRFCTTSNNCVSDLCFICLNEKTDINKCINAGKAPTNVVSLNLTCPLSGLVTYGWGAPGDTCYALNAGVGYSAGGAPYCINQNVDKTHCCNNSAQPKLFIARACCPDGNNPKCNIPTLVPIELTVENLSQNICPSIKGKVAHIYKDYGGGGIDACVKFNGLYYSTSKPNPVVTKDVISNTDIEKYCSTDSSLTYNCQ